MCEADTEVATDSSETDVAECKTQQVIGTPTVDENYNTMNPLLNPMAQAHQQQVREEATEEMTKNDVTQPLVQSEPAQHAPCSKESSNVPPPNTDTQVPTSSSATAASKKRKSKGRSTKAPKTTSTALIPAPKDSKRIRHMRKDQKLMRQQLYDIELKLEMFESNMPPPQSTNFPTPTFKSASCQTGSNNTSEASCQTSDTFEKLADDDSDETTSRAQETALNDNSELIAARNNLAELHTQLYENNTQLDIARQQITQLTSSKLELSNQLNAATQRVAELEGAAHRDGELQQQISQLSSSNSDLTSQLQEARQTITVLRDASHPDIDLQQQITQLKSTNHKLSVQLREIQQQNKDLRSDSELVSGENNELRTSRSKLSEKLRATEKQNVDLNALLETLRHREPIHKRNSIGGKNTDDDDHDDDHAVPKPDVLFFHDSLGKRINDTILKNEKLVTEKSLTYKLEDIQQEINKRPTIPHRAVVIHCGTNNLNVDGQTPDTIVQRMEELVHSIQRKSPNTRILISSIVRRKDNARKQRELQYINAAVELRCTELNNVSVVHNDNIDEGCLGTDLIHLGKKGTSRLAVNIKKAVAKALDIPVVTRPRT